MSIVERVPIEVWRLIFSKLPCVLAIPLVCKTWRRIAGAMNSRMVQKSRILLECFVNSSSFYTRSSSEGYSLLDLLKLKVDNIEEIEEVADPRIIRVFLKCLRAYRWDRGNADSKIFNILDKIVQYESGLQLLRCTEFYHAFKTMESVAPPFDERVAKLVQTIERDWATGEQDYHSHAYCKLFKQWQQAPSEKFVGYLLNAALNDFSPTTVESSMPFDAYKIDITAIIKLIASALESRPEVFQREDVLSVLHHFLDTSKTEHYPRRSKFDHSLSLEEAGCIIIEQQQVLPREFMEQLIPLTVTRVSLAGAKELVTLFMQTPERNKPAFLHGVAQRPFNYSDPFKLREFIDALKLEEGMSHWVEMLETIMHNMSRQLELETSLSKSSNISVEYVGDTDVIRVTIGDPRTSTWTYIQWQRSYYYWECEIVSLPNNGAICKIGGRTEERRTKKGRRGGFELTLDNTGVVRMNQVEVCKTSSTFGVGDVIGFGLNNRNTGYFWAKNGELIAEYGFPQATKPAIYLTDKQPHNSAIELKITLQSPFKFKNKTLMINFDNSRCSGLYVAEDPTVNAQSLCNVNAQKPHELQSVVLSKSTENSSNTEVMKSERTP